MSYEFKCPDCGSNWDCSTTEELDFGSEIECCRCGRVSKIVTIHRQFEVRATDTIKSPTKLEEMEKMENEN